MQSSGKNGPNVPGNWRNRNQMSQLITLLLPSNRLSSGSVKGNQLTSKPGDVPPLRM